MGAAHQSCIDYVNKVNQHKFIHVLYHNFSKYDYHLFFNDLITSKNDKVKQSEIPRTNEEFMALTYRCIKFLDSMTFQQDSLEKVTDSLSDRLYPLKTTISKSLDAT